MMKRANFIAFMLLVWCAFFVELLGLISGINPGSGNIFASCSSLEHSSRYVLRVEVSSRAIFLFLN